MGNQLEFVALKFAIARAGAVAVPINFLNRRDELGVRAEAIERRIAGVTMDRFRDLDYLGMLDELAPTWVCEGGGDAFPRLRRIVVFATGDRPVRARAPRRWPH